MKLASTTLLALVLPGQCLLLTSGCGFADVGRSNYAALLAERACGQAPCNRDQWVVLTGQRDNIKVTWPSKSLPQHRMQFVQPDEELEVIAVSVRPSDLLAAIARRDGIVYTARLDGLAEEASAQVNAVGLGWSNAGDRLAVVSRDPATRAHSLVLFGPDLTEISRYALPARYGPSPIGPGTTVSWSADDELVALSDEATLSTPEIKTTLVELASGGTATAEYAGFLFIGERSAVATIRPAEGFDHVAVVELDDLAMREVGAIEGARQTVTSVPTAGVFVTHEPEVGLGYVLTPAAVRTRDVGPEYLDAQLLQGARTALVPAASMEGLLVDGWWWETENDLSAELDPSLRP